MKKPFTARMYSDLVLMMYEAGLENAYEQYLGRGRRSSGETSRGFIKRAAETDFDFNSDAKECIYQDLIDQAATNEWGEGVTLSKEDTIITLGQRLPSGYVIMCKEYGHMSDSAEQNEDGSYDADMWTGLDSEDVDMLEEDTDNEYQTFVLTCSGLDSFDVEEAVC